MMLTFLSSSWIDFLASCICLFEYSVKSPIIFNSRLLNSFSWPIHYLWIEVLSCCGSLEEKHYLSFSCLNSYIVFCAFVCLICILLPWVSVEPTAEQGKQVSNKSNIWLCKEQLKPPSVSSVMLHGSAGCGEGRRGC
jgi:hypothetical protein